MKNEIKKYLLYIREIANKETITNKDTILEKLLIQIKFIQHERLIHLIVTIFVGLSTLILLGLGIFAESIGFILTALITLILFIFYIFHYYFLENTTQELYKHYFSIKEKK